MQSVTDKPGRAIIFTALDPALRNGLAENRTDIIIKKLDSAGLAIVPKEPTEKMLIAARDWSQEKYGKPVGNDAAQGCWAAMLAAAQKEPP